MKKVRATKKYKIIKEWWPNGWRYFARDEQGNHVKDSSGKTPEKVEEFLRSGKVGEILVKEIEL